MHFFRITLGLILIFLVLSSGAQPITDTSISGKSTFTIYVIPSKAKFDWSSPKTLYKSYRKNTVKNLFSKNNYTLGHAFIELNSAQPEEHIITGMCSAGKEDMQDFVLKEHYGLAVLGADVKGHLEDETKLKEKIEKYSRKGRLAFITIMIGDIAAERMSRFFNAYREYFDHNEPGGYRYGGAFWPRYHGEGSGCSGFALSFMSVAGLLQEEYEHWLVRINIPMNLIGGPYNPDNEVSMKDIKKEEHWAQPDQNGQKESQLLEMYDPTLIFEWINGICDGKINRDEDVIKTVSLKKAKGLLVDGRNSTVPLDQDIFLERTDRSIFIDYYFGKISPPE